MVNVVGGQCWCLRKSIFKVTRLGEGVFSEFEVINYFDCGANKKILNYLCSRSSI